MTIAIMRISPSQKFAVASVAAFTVVVLAAWGFGRAVAVVRHGRIMQADIRQKIDVLADERQRARSSQTLLNDREGDLRRINAFFVDRESPIAFIEAVENAARKTGNTVVLDIDEQAGGDTVLRFRLTLEGKESGLGDFVTVLELLPYRIDVQDMVFQSMMTETGSVASDKAPARLLLSLDVSAR